MFYFSLFYYNINIFKKYKNTFPEYPLLLKSPKSLIVPEYSFSLSINASNLLRRFVYFRIVKMFKMNGHWRFCCIKCLYVLIILDVRESTESLMINGDKVSLLRRLEIRKSSFLKPYVLFQKMLGNKSKWSD